MMMWDRKKAMDTIISRRKPSGEVEMAPTPMKMEVVTDEDGEMDGRHQAAQDILAAHHEKSPMKLMEALGNFLDMHMAQSDKPEPKE